MDTHSTGARQIIEDHVKRSYATQPFPEAWRNLPEVPGQTEIMPLGPTDSSDEEDVYEALYHKDKPYGARIPINIVNGPWSSNVVYVAAHYQILREDAVGCLRESVATVKSHPSMLDDQSTCIYTHVYFKGILASNQGAAFRVEFSYERAGKKIRWEQSKRLQQGTLVALTPQSDKFNSICKMATIAARPIKGGLDQNPPSVDLFWGDSNEAEFQPGEPWMMVESRTGYFEAARHMLVALQKLMTEKFPLQRHIVKVCRDVKPPRYIRDQPLLSMNSLRDTTVPKENQADVSEDDTSLDNVDILQEFPEIANTGLDSSQLDALQRMLRKQLAIIQGPPGTGKTFVSVAALMIMLENWTEGDPPIIVAAQTNHALDQLLNHIKSYMPDFVRLGGRGDRENVDIQERTLYSLRMKSEFKEARRGINGAHAQLKGCIQELQLNLASMIVADNPNLDQKMLERGILTQAQFESLQDDNWVTASEEWQAPNRLYSWLGQEQLVPIEECPSINMGFKEEEIDLEFEQLQELELEASEGPDDNDQDALRGTWISFKQKWTGRHTPGWSDRRMTKYLSGKPNLWQVPAGLRGEVFRYLGKKMYQGMRQVLRDHLKNYTEATQRIKIERDVSNVNLVHQLGIKLIGCTTTGLSKYRGFLASLKPRAMLIEEAAETLEGTITAAMLETLEHLILVGDHKQLQAHGNIQTLQQAPYNLNISLFERMMMNAVEYTMLNRQRRMIPEIRKLLCTERSPFYRDLQDHPSVHDRVNNRPPVDGMGGKDTFFFGHNWPEIRDNDASRSNVDEAEMIAGFFSYLVMNGVKPAKITVLTFYNGQRKLILGKLKRRPDLAFHTYFNVFTVDSYQGEENDIVLLSLVRSNNYVGIGFLENQNRLVVALSRARRGLYIFGNPVTLTAKSPGKLLYDPIIEHLGRQGRFNLVNGDGSPASGFPVTCSNHGRVVEIFEAAGWDRINGGCDRACGGELPCGHACYAKCHSFDHDIIRCKEPCPSVLDCGHLCSEPCGTRCRCHGCERQPRDEMPQRLSSQPRDVTWPRSLESTLSSPDEQEVSPTKRTQQSYLSAQESWNSWDAQKADRELEIQRQQLLASAPQPETSVFNEIFRPAVIQDGVRVVSTGVRRTINRRAPAPGDDSDDSNQDKSSKIPAIKEAPSSPVKDSTFDDFYDVSDPEDMLKARPGNKIPNQNATTLIDVAGPSRIFPVKALSDEVSLLDLDERESSRSAITGNIAPQFEGTNDQDEDLISFD